MKKLLTLVTSILAMTVAAQDLSEYDLNKPFGFCTVSSRTDASSTYDITGGGCYTYPIPDDFTGTVKVLKSNGQDMKVTIQNAIKQNDVVILDGADGDFIVSQSIGFERGNKTILGINNARLCTQWYITDEIKELLDNATDDRTPDKVGVKNMSTNAKDNLGGTVAGQTIKEQAEYNVRKILYEKYENENYRKSGIFSLNKENVIIRNITFVGPGSIDASGNDLISATGAKHCWIDHCTFQDGMDGNFDITEASNYITVSWCTFKYTARSYMHQNTNLVGSSDDKTSDASLLNTTFAFNWWGPGCKQRMPMARYGKIHMLNNYFNCSGASNCINPRKNSEFLIEGNYIDNSVPSFYSQSGATSVTWANNNYTKGQSKPANVGSTVTVPYNYTVASYSNVPTEVQKHAGATLKYGDSSSEEPTGTKGSVYWPMSSDNNATVAEAINEDITSTNVENGSNLILRTYGTYGGIRFALFQAQSIQTAPANDNAVTFSLTTKSGSKFKATSIELYASKIGTNNGTIDISWQDAGGTTKVVNGVSPNRNNEENNYFSFLSKEIDGISKATDGTCSLIINMYNVGAMNNGALQKKDIGLAQITVKGYIVDQSTGISTPVIMRVSDNGTIYNLAGQKVDASYKGVVIKNGKKYVIK